PAIFLIIFDLVYFAIGTALNGISEIITRIEKHTRKNIDNIQTSTRKEVVDKEPND
ncbi:26637_t:CDS:1, partial [Gigaspora margarita]